MSDPRNDAEPSEARSAARAERLEFRPLAARMNHRQCGAPIVLGANEAGGDAQFPLAALECGMGPGSE